MNVEKRNRLIFFTTLLFIALGGLVAIGTLIPQGLSYVAYIEAYGLKGANIICALGLDHLYQHSLLWLLLFFLSINLCYYLVCSAKKFKIKGIFLGKWFLHLGIVLILLASAGIALTGAEERFELAIGEEKTAQVKEFKGISLKLLDFDVEFYKEGLPKQYLAKVALKVNNESCVDTLKVNYPLYFKNIRVYQDSYAWESFGSFEYSGKKIPFRLKIGDQVNINRGKIDTLFLPSYDKLAQKVGTPKPTSPHLLVRYHNEEKKEEVIIPYKKASVIGGIKVTFTDFKPYSGLYIKTAKGLSCLKLGYFFLILGSFIIFYLKVRR